MKRALLVISIIIIVVVIVLGIMTYKTDKPKQPAVPTKAPVAETNVSASETGQVSTAIVGARPVSVGRGQSFASPSSDTNEIARIAMERSARAEANLREYQEAVRLNQTQEIKPASQTAAK